MISARFQRPIVVSRHALLRMAERDINDSQLVEIIDTGSTRFKDATHLWAFKHLEGRSDNLVCAVLVIENVIVVKTVMHNFVLET
jgi:hypothetical protein